jgi:hypothetical protein
VKKQKKICFSLSTAEGNFGFGCVILEQVLLWVLLDLITMITDDKPSFQGS